MPDELLLLLEKVEKEAQPTNALVYVFVVPLMLLLVLILTQPNWYILGVNPLARCS